LILYTIVPLSTVFYQDSSFIPEPEEIFYRGAILQVTPVSPNKYRIERIISTQLNDYLNPQVQPGTIIKTGPKLKG